MNNLIAYLIAGCVALGVVVGAMGHALTHKCPTTASVIDSVMVANTRTDTIQIRDTIRIVKRVIDRVTDTIIKWPSDTICAVKIDTTTADGAVIGVQVEAALIAPPVRSTLTYTPPPVVVRTVNIPIIEYRSDWRMVALAGAVGLTSGLIIDRVASK